MTDSCMPKEAWPVVQEIRRLVPKPKELPEPEDPGDSAEPCLGWDRGRGSHELYCPLGLLPYALEPRPSDQDNFSYEGNFERTCHFNMSEAAAFFVWWDSQHDAAAAVEEVWEKSLDPEDVKA